MKPSTLIYLDTGFIVEVYEGIHNEPVPIKVSRSDTFTGGLSIPFISGGASTTETKEFPLNTRQMYEKVHDVLLSIPAVTLCECPPEKLPEYFWAKGVLGACGSQNWSGGKVIDRSSHFSFYSQIGSLDYSLNLVVNDVYMSTGYDQLQKHLGGSCQGFGIEVHGLFKLLATDLKYPPICAPLVMEKLRNV